MFPLKGLSVSCKLNVQQVSTLKFVGVRTPHPLGLLSKILEVSVDNVCIINRHIGYLEKRGVQNEAKKDVVRTY